MGQKPSNALCFSRRQAIFLSGSVVALQLAPVSARADEACDAISRMIYLANAARQETGSWALTVSPSHVQELENAVAQLEEASQNATDLADHTKFNAYLAVLNALIASGFAIAGATGAVAATPLLIASIGISGAMLIADTLTAPRSPESLDIVRDIGINRVGGLLSIAGEDAYAVSTNSARIASKAGNIVSIIGAGMAAFEAAKKLGLSATRSEEEKALWGELDAIKQEIANLRNIAYVEEVRTACMTAIEKDLTDAYSAQAPICIKP